MTTAERLAYYSRPDGDCVLYTGTLTPTGYGAIYDSEQRRRRAAHRVAYEIHVGPIPDGLCILHARDCPNRNCVNPAHLRPGTQKENMADREAVGHGRGRGTPPPCSVDGCDRTSRNHDTLLCDPHYRRLRRNGSVGSPEVRTGAYANRWA